MNAERSDSITAGSSSTTDSTTSVSSSVSSKIWSNTPSVYA